MKDQEREAYDYANAMPTNILKALAEFQQEVKKSKEISLYPKYYLPLSKINVTYGTVERC
jgi:hypothetical protein